MTKIKPIKGYAWRITRGDFGKGHWMWVDPGVEVESPDEIDWSGATKFRMLDDDEEVYSYGDYLGPDDETLFAPLDDYGTPALGATAIDLKEDGKWVRL